MGLNRVWGMRQRAECYKLNHCLVFVIIDDASCSTDINLIYYMYWTCVGACFIICFISTVPCISLMLYQSVSHIIVEAVRATKTSPQGYVRATRQSP